VIDLLKHSQSDSCHSCICRRVGQTRGECWHYWQTPVDEC